MKAKRLAGVVASPTSAIVGGVTGLLKHQNDESQSFSSRALGPESSELGDNANDLSEQEDNEPVVRSTSITVAVRKRPKIKNREEKENDVVRSEGQDGCSITVYAPKMRVDLTPVIEPTTFAFDYVFDDKSSNYDVYRLTTKPLLDTVQRGGSAVVFAFGQTGSGKTYTMLGHQGLDPGIYSLAVRDMLTLVDHQTTLSASFYEVYGSKLFDLLNDRCEVKVLQDEYKNIHIVGLRERPVDSSADLTELMDAGQQLRACGTTSANDRSSRSHAVLVLNLRRAGRGDEDLFGRMTFVDLAGSERATDTQNTDNKTRREGAEINKSLLALKECIRAMGMKKRHIPFRGSKLTQILRESFIGNSQTCVIANVSPCQSHCEDTLNTLRYADRIKSLKSGNGGVGGDDGDAPIPCHNCGLPIFVGDRHVCRRVVTQCPHCRVELEKDKLEGHLGECKEVPMRCQYCNERFLQGDLTKHNRKCSKFPTRCGPCGETVPRNLMEKHVQTECMQSKGVCRYCRGQYIRYELGNHEESCGHMQICCQYCLMVVKKSRMEGHLAECACNPQRIQRPKPAPQPSTDAMLRRIPSKVISTSPQPPSNLQPVRRGRPVGSARSRSPVPQAPSPPLGNAPTLKPRHAVVSSSSQATCKHCARFVSANLLANHIKSECMYVPVRCPYEAYGCKWEAVRGRLAGHILESTNDHLDMVQRFAEHVSKENHSLKERIASLEGAPNVRRRTSKSQADPDYADDGSPISIAALLDETDEPHYGSDSPTFARGQPGGLTVGAPMDATQSPTRSSLSMDSETDSILGR